MKILEKMAVFTVMGAVLFCLGASPAGAQDLWLWPVKGQEAGEGIVSRPQQYIDGELNFSNLFVSAPEGTEVVSPADGTLDWFTVGFYQSLSYSSGYHFSADNFDAAFRELEEAGAFGNIPVPVKYVNGSVTIRLNDGRKLHIGGLTGDIPMKTGMKIRRGDPIGRVGYNYYKIQEPHIGISVSTRKGTVDDPMSPFGLESTFISPGELVIPDTLAEEQANEDFAILMKAYKDLFPSMDDIVTPEQFEAFRTWAAGEFRGGISYRDFYGVVRASTTSRLMHDSHLAVLTPDPRLEDQRKVYVPNIIHGIVNDTVFVRQVSEKYREHLGKRIISIDGMDADEICRRTMDMVARYDGNNRSIVDETMLGAWNYLYCNEIDVPRTTTVVLEDSTVIEDRWVRNTSARNYFPKVTMDVAYIRNMIEAQKSSFGFSRLNDSTVLFRLSSFALNDVEVEQLKDSLRNCMDMPYMIMDVRNNPGGDAYLVEKMASWFLNSPSVRLDSYFMVNDTIFDVLKYSLNYPGDEPVFEGFRQRNGMKGFYSEMEDDSYKNAIQPDSSLNYKGKLYILTDESSVSAATDFPALMVRNHRAVTVGRETGTGYHYMTAYKFADIRLPNSYIKVRIPLVKCVFDGTVTERTPPGRGLLPDYEVPLSYAELYTSETDLILDKALSLIAEGRYLGENPFSDGEEKNNSLLWITGGLLLVGFALLLVFGRRKRI